MLSVIIPAHNEEAYLAPCLDALFGQDDPSLPVQIIVMANGCTDSTASLACGYKAGFAAKGWRLRVLRTAQGGKLRALNCADRAIQNTGSRDVRVYLDADVVASPGLLAQLCTALDTDQPRYATGALRMAPARSWVTRQYARFWAELPFMKDEGPGAGVFATNAAGRTRWGEFPDIISDDTFVRLSFAPSERIQVTASYQWPLVEGFGNLVRVRRRQDKGVSQLRALHPKLFENEGKSPLKLGPLVVGDPLGFAVYGAVSLAVKLGAGQSTAWTRGR